MVKSMTGFPRRDSSDSEELEEAEQKDCNSIKSSPLTQGLKVNATAVFKNRRGRAAAATRTINSRGGKAQLGVQRGKVKNEGFILDDEPVMDSDGNIFSVALPSGLKNVSSVCIVFDPVFGPRLRRIADVPSCDSNEHQQQRHPELLEVNICTSSNPAFPLVQVLLLSLILLSLHLSLLSSLFAKRG
jgi:hypothetical protein